MIEHCFSHAKINLFLYVTGRRPDGYHNLYSLMTQIGLKDDLFFDHSSSSIQVECAHPDVPEDSSNLVCIAAQKFFSACRSSGFKEKPGVFIRIDKQIPPGGGLGGGSSNAATVLKTLNRHYGCPLSDSRLAQIAVSVGADVPFFLDEKPALIEGIGEKIQRIEKLKPYYLVMCDPGVAASTAQVYRNIDFNLTSEPKYNIKSGLNVPLRGQGVDVGNMLHNDLMEPALRLYPEIRKTKEEMECLLKKPVHMTGSGSTLFALYSTPENAKEKSRELEERFQGSARNVFVSSFC